MKVKCLYLKNWGLPQEEKIFPIRELNWFCYQKAQEPSEPDLTGPKRRY